MAHVRLVGDGPNGGRIWIDGTEVESTAEGFRVTYDGDLCRFKVQVEIYAETLDVDLPDAVLEAARAEAS